MNPLDMLNMKDCLASQEGKRKFNEAHFAEAACHYDFATKAMSLGRDRFWKDALIRFLPDKQRPVCLDLACGTGDLCFRLAERYPGGAITGLDLTAAMIELAHARNPYDHIDFVTGDMCHIDQDENCVDIVTGGYALRNAPDIDLALTEIHRVMKPGATAAFLDFSKPESRVMGTMNYLLLKVWGRFWGWVLHRNAEVHGYISESLKTYPNRKALKERIQQAGFSDIRSQRYFLGIMETIIFDKPT